MSWLLHCTAVSQHRPLLIQVLHLQMVLLLLRLLHVHAMVLLPSVLRLPMDHL